MLGKLFGSIIGEVFGLARDHLQGQRDIKKARIESEIALAQKRAQHAIDWEIIWASQADRSWKDEWFVILHSIPVIMVFIPGLAPYVAEGFSTLQDTVPEWFITFYGAGVAASFGLRGLKDAHRNKAAKDFTKDILNMEKNKDGSN